MAKNLTIGDVLPSEVKSEYSAKILATSLDEALGIAKYQKPSTSGLSTADMEKIDQIYSKYLKQGGKGGSDSAYWNKSQSENDAYWNKNKG